MLERNGRTPFMQPENKQRTYAQVLKYMGVFGSVQGLNLVMGLVRNKLIAVLLGPSGMGLASLFNTSVAFLSKTTGLGLSFSAVRNISEAYEQQDEAALLRHIQIIRTWSILTSLFGMLICVSLGPLLSDLTFSWGNHTWHFILLAPAIGLLAITGGETAILKGTRRLRALATIQIVSILASVLISIPVYYFFEQAGIVPVIVLMAFATMAATIFYSYRFYPLRLGGAWGLLHEGMSMVQLGIGFTAAGIIASGSEMWIRSYLNVTEDLDGVGLYNAGCVLTITYAGMVFSALDSDYFPRLSACAKNTVKLSQVVNQQIEICLLIIAPMIAGLILLLPTLIPILFTDKFLPIVPMAQIAIFSMFFKSLSLPTAYITLSKGDSKAFLTIETLYALTFVGLFVVFHKHYGLIGTGIALTLSYVGEWIFATSFAYWRYGYRSSVALLKYASLLILCPIGVYITSQTTTGLSYWILGAAFVLGSIFISLRILSQKTEFMSMLRSKLKGKKV
jgi:O-antigen/teichoic acid export membrane protein